MRQWHHFACHIGVNDTAVHIIAVSLTLANNLTPCFFIRESDSAAHGIAVSLIPLWHAQLWYWYRYDMHSSANETAVQIWHRCDFGPHIREALATFKGNIYRKSYIGKLSSTMPITLTQKIWGLTRDRFCHSGLIDTAMPKIGDFIVDFLREFEAIFKKALTNVSGA
jgi:hypothetical protein